MNPKTMFSKHILRSFLLLLLSCIAWQACKKSDFEQAELGDHTAEFAFPLFTTDLKLKDLLFNVLNDTLSGDTIFINPDNTMTLFYSGDVAQKPATDIFKFIESGLVPLSSDTVSNPIQTPNGVSISQAKLSGGTMSFVFSNPLSDTITGFFEIPELNRNGEGFKHPFILLPNEQNRVFGSFDMNGYELNSSSNTLTFQYAAYLPNGTKIKVPNQANGFPNVFAVFLNLKFSYVQGYWGYQLYPLTRDTIEIDINQTDLRGDIKVVNPKVTMRVRNSWGFPTRGIIKYLSFIGQNGEELQLQGTAFQNDGTNDYADFAYPSFIAGELGQEKITDIYMDESNSNIADIFNLQPTRLVYEVDGVSNAQLDPNLIGFMTDQSVLGLQMRVELVLEGSAKNFGAEQTLDLNFDGFGSLDSANIESVEFKLVSENGTPVDINAQIYFRDEAGTDIDSLFDAGAKNILNAAPVNNHGIASGVTRTETFIPMTAARFDRIRTTKTAFMKAYFTTAQGGTIPVKLLADNSSTVKLGIKVKKRLTGE
jgi:hypothetical protein